MGEVNVFSLFTSEGRGQGGRCPRLWFLFLSGRWEGGRVTPAAWEGGTPPLPSLTFLSPPLSQDKGTLPPLPPSLSQDRCTPLPPSARTGAPPLPLARTGAPPPSSQDSCSLSFRSPFHPLLPQPGEGQDGYAGWTVYLLRSRKRTFLLTDIKGSSNMQYLSLAKNSTR